MLIYIISAMKIWISKNSEVAVREQLIAQITLAIAAGDLSVGEKLPSTREIARRCDLHSNTIGSAYQKLVDQKLLEFKKGSGFYVAESASERIEGTRKLEQLIANVFETAQSLGFSKSDVIGMMVPPRPSSTSGEIVIVESDTALRQILLHEVSRRFPKATGISLEEYISGTLPAGATLAAMLDEKPKMDPHLNGSQRCVYLKGRSVSASMSGQNRPAPDEIVAVVSGWDGFLSFARIILLAANIDPGSLVIRSTADEGWKNAIDRASIIICDTLTANSLDGVHPIRQFQIISDESLDELAEITK